MSTKEAVKTLTETKQSSVPAHLQAKIKEDAGKGVSSKQEDNIIPLIGILQAMSPQVNKRDPNYVEGAETGDILLKNAPSPLVKGDKGILVQPVSFHREHVEWIPREKGGGFAGRHPELPKEAKESVDPSNPNKKRYVMPNGNEIIETRYHAVAVHLGELRLPYVIPMTSSGHTVSRNWMFMMNSKMIDGAVAPSFAGLYTLKTKERKNAAGTWMTWDISDAGWVQEEVDYDRGRALNEAISSGEKEIEIVKDDQESTPKNNDDTM